MAKQKQTQEIAFEEVVERGCGLDVHKKEIVATVNGTGIESETRTFRSTTRSLTELKEWLLALGVTHVAMESTGVYWKPVMNILEPGGFAIMVVNARHIKYVPGHKTDRKDSAWICKLLRAGLLKGSFVPGRNQRDLRDLTRYRRKLVQQQSAEHNRMIRIFEDANLKLSSVFSNIRGKTCTRVIRSHSRRDCPSETGCSLYRPSSESDQRGNRACCGGMLHRASQVHDTGDTHEHHEHRGRD